MSSIVEIRKELETIQEDLAKEVKSLVEIEDSLDFQKVKVEVLKKHKMKLEKVLSILEDKEPVQQQIIIPQEQPPPAELPKQIAQVEPSGSVAPMFKCSACGGGMSEMYRTMRSGVVVKLLKCNDSGCNNENYLG